MSRESLAAMHHIDRIPTLLEHSHGDRDLNWLKYALQSAVSVEFSTIPPYLCALWSIKDDRDPVAASIRNVVHEEMLHMSLVCNMLVALGEVPQINDPNMVPRYPGQIPGMLHPELTVSLCGLSDTSLEVFVAIEQPSEGDSPERSEDADVPPDVWVLINDCDITFTSLLNRLQAVWEEGDQSPFVHAIDTMFKLTDQARRLMAIEIGEGLGNYGPRFRRI